MSCEMNDVRPCFPNETCKECLARNFKNIYPDIDKITVDGANLELTMGVLGDIKVPFTTRIINDAVIIQDGDDWDYLCNVIDQDEEDCKSVKLLLNDAK